MTTNRFDIRPAGDRTEVIDSTIPVGSVASFENSLRGEVMATELAAALNLELGDVITDSYGNPAVVVRFEIRGTRNPRVSIIQLCGSDRGRVTSAPSHIQPVTDEASITEARDVCRTQARLQGLKWDANGIV